MSTFADSAARNAYDALAPAYDLLTADYCHERWLEVIEQTAVAHGLRGRRLLDAACGTGKSFMPLRERGYEVCAFDVSEAMVEIAREKAPEAEIFVSDLRTLGRVGEFDLITCLDDSLNYLLQVDDLVGALGAFRVNLAPRGVAVWDVNTLAMYRTAFASDWLCESDDTFVAWKGLTPVDLSPGNRAAARVEVFARDRDRWERTTSVHQQRHWPAGELSAAAAAAGLRVLAVYGQHRGAVLEVHLDETTHTKALVVACRDDAPLEPGGGHMRIGGP